MLRVAHLMIIGVLCAISGCFTTPGTIRDIRELKQDHVAYLDRKAAETPMMSPEDQKQRDQDYNDRYFSPWHRSQSKITLAEITQEFEKYARSRGYGEHGRKYDQNWVKKLETNACLKSYPNAGSFAITIRHANMRVLPTTKPHFGSVGQAVSGYPFDNLQVSSVMVNTPVYVSHVSRDRAWLMAETAYSSGWMRAEDVASVTGGFMRQWETGNYAVIIRDKTPLYDGNGRFLFYGCLGAIFPRVNGGEKGLAVHVAVADADRHAVLKKVTLSGDTAAAKPIRATAAQMARLANELTNEPYGWGGLRGNRDCSSMIRDLLAPFGLWLPRHSADQARDGGTFIDLSVLSAEEKEKKIMSDGIPYLTLLWRPGHVVLYVGAFNGEPLVFHNFWGVTTKSLFGRKGKMIVGHSAITTMHPGRELHNYNKDASDLTTNIQGMTLLARRYEKPTPAAK